MNPLHSEIPLVGFLPDGRTFLTKSGDCGLVIKVHGVDPDCLENHTVNHIAERVESAAGMLDDRCVLMQLYFRYRVTDFAHQGQSHPILDMTARSRKKHLVDSGLYAEELYYVLLYLDPRAQRGFWQALRKHRLKEYFRRRSHQELVESEVRDSQRQVREKAEAFVLQMQDVVPMEILDYERAFNAFYRLANLEPFIGTFGANDWLDYRLADSGVSSDYDHLLVGNNYAVALSLKHLPAESQPLMLLDLQKIKGDFHIATTWQPLDQNQQERLLKDKKAHLKRGEKSFAAAAFTKTDGEAVRDEGKAAAGKKLGELQAEASEGDSGGLFSLTALTYGGTLEEAQATAAEVQKVFARHRASLIVDRYNQPNAFFSMIPGAYRRLYRRAQLLNAHHADMSFWVQAGEGCKENTHLQGECLAVVKTKHHTPFYLNLHGAPELGMEDLGHTLVIGQTGAGKSVLASWLISQLQKYDPFTLLFDIGGSYEGVTAAFNGVHVRVDAAQHNCRINPFAKDLTPDARQWLTYFVCALLGNATDEDKVKIYDEIPHLYALSPQLRTLGYFVRGLSKRLRDALAPWVGEGQYARWFDGAEDTVTMHSFQCFDFPVTTDPKILGPLLLYVFHRVDEVVKSDPQRLKAFFIDEAWKFLLNDTVADYVLGALKTWRKHRGFVVLLTHSLDDLRDAKTISRRLSESCSTQLFLANPRINEDYAETFKLTERELEEIRTLRMRDEFLFKQAGTSKRLSVALDPVALLLTSTASSDRKRRQEAFAVLGPVEGLKSLVDQP